MDKSAVLEILSRFKKALESRGVRIDKLILFGSYAKGTQREWSDIDIVVVSDDFAGKNYWDRIDILTDAIYNVFEPIEAIAMTPDEWATGQSPIVEFSKTGEIVYAA